MNFNTANTTFRQLMGNGLLYREPLFQRDYSWSAYEWEISDRISLFSTGNSQCTRKLRKTTHDRSHPPQIRRCL
ncbi:MAG: hypothetical protein D3919_06825 [Candidatus Electrothrix sp. AW5]|nr:hypothetical protein [Candidatus Electrothrix sp. AX1]MCI5182907.1 hypothetical protein [Candidatus Electrothrix gigas]MCI5195937.1 hypothetical protein [Candidatus Electrothrix gigas]